MRKVFLLLTFILVLVFIFVLVHIIAEKPDPYIDSHIQNVKQKSQTIRSEIKHDAIIKINEVEITIQTANTTNERAKGLSGKAFLGENEGMIFTFSQKTYPAFWMKDMNFALDIIWILNDTIIHIDENVPSPKPEQNESDLPLYKPPKAVNYVLEVNAGFCQRNGIKVGDSVEINI